MKKSYLVEWGKGESKTLPNKREAVNFAAILLQTYFSVSIKVTYKDIES